MQDRLHVIKKQSIVCETPTFYVV